MRPPVRLKEETMSNIYDLLKRAEEDKQAKGEGEEEHIVDIGDLEMKKMDLFPGFSTEEILAVSKEQGLPDGENVSVSPSCLTEMVQDIKKGLASLVRTALMGVEKANDAEFKKHSRDSVMKDYKKVDLVLRMLLSYIRMSQPILKKDTIHAILEEVLAGREKELRAKSITVVRKYHDQILETTVHEEQLRFILGSILQYTILATSVNGEISVVTKPVHLQKSLEEERIVPLKGRYSEVSIYCSYPGEHVSDLGKSLESSNFPQEEGLRSVVLVVRELVQKSQGSCEFEVDKKDLLRRITLRFPAERRQAVYYKPIHS